MTTDRSAKIPQPGGPEYYYQLTLNNLLVAIEYCDNPHQFRDYLFALMQLYHDGLIKDPGCKKLDQDTRSAVLDGLLLAGKQFTGQYFNNFRNNSNDIYLDEIRGLVLAYDSKIAKYNSRSSAKNRHMDDERYTLETFKSAITQIQEPLESIVIVASGGFEPGCLAAHELGVDSIIPVRFSHYSGDRNDPKVKVHRPGLLEPDMRLLVTEDITESGKSLWKVTEWVMQHPFKSLYAAIVIGGNHNPFTSSSVVYEPDPCSILDSTHIWKYEPK